MTPLAATTCYQASSNPAIMPACLGYLSVCMTVWLHPSLPPSHPRPQTLPSSPAAPLRRGPPCCLYTSHGVSRVTKYEVRGWVCGRHGLRCCTSCTHSIESQKPCPAFVPSCSSMLTYSHAHAVGSHALSKTRPRSELRHAASPSAVTRSPCPEQGIWSPSAPQCSVLTSALTTLTHQIVTQHNHNWAALHLGKTQGIFSVSRSRGAFRASVYVSAPPGGSGPLNNMSESLPVHISPSIIARSSSLILKCAKTPPRPHDRPLRESP